MKRGLCIFLALFLLVGITGCSAKSDGGENIKLKNLDFQSIAYEASQTVFETSNDIRVNVLSSGETGKKITANISINKTFENYNYYVVDWGDGTWSYNGPYKPTIAGSCTHSYKTSGTYKVKALCMNMGGSDSIGWSKESTITISGDKAEGTFITAVKPISSSEQSSEYSTENIIDSKNTTSWRSQKASSIESQEWVGLEFDTQYSLDTIEIKIPTDAQVWPSNIAIEYTTDRGKTWYNLPKYYYVYSYSESRYTPIMNFPNPKGATLVLDLDGVVANGIRLSSKLFSLANPKADKYLEVSEMRVTGDTRPLFYTSKGGIYDADLNNMWTIYGSADTEPTVTGSKAGPNPDPFRSGCATITSTEWLEWDGLQILWRNNINAVKPLYDMTLFQAIVSSDGNGNDGYVWATKDSMQHLGVQNHYTYNQIFIIAARNYLFIHNDSNGFFEKTNSRGQTMDYRIEKAMEYMLTVMKGTSGVLTITDPKNDATSKGVSSNYWDSIKAFGYQSAYENTLYYQSLLAMADIEQYKNQPDKANEYIALAAKVKAEFNKTFWDEEKGRYITSIDKNGKKIDFGITFVNTMAVSAGLCDTAQSKRIYEWLDGKRIIEGETSTGSDIYDAFQISARTNTIDISSTGSPYLWWDHGGAMPCTTGTLGGYGNQMQNGGTIFYTSYYDIMGRIKSGDVTSANARFDTILEEFHKDQLRRFPYTVYGGYVAGVIGEFPESGLVPLTFLNGFLGITVSQDGLTISPNLPKDMDYAGVREFVFNGTTYSIKVNKNISKPKAQQVGSVWFVELPADQKWTITAENQLMGA